MFKAMVKIPTRALLVAGFGSPLSNNIAFDVDCVDTSSRDEAGTAVIRHRATVGVYCVHGCSFGHGILNVR